MSKKNKEHKRKLVERYARNRASEKELHAFFGLMDSGELQSAIEADMDKEIAALEKRMPWFRNRSRMLPYILAAACIALVIFGGLYMIGIKQIRSDSQYARDATPGKSSATLTLANGKKIALSDAVNGELANEAGIRVFKNADGQLVYEIKGADQQNTDPDATNTLSTAKGETYQVRLPDGTNVWINAASSLKYPVSFSPNSGRFVELTGEGYFEVTKSATAKTKKSGNVALPFTVKTATQTVEVLGTHFNVTSYAEEARTVTTLAEGSVKVSLLNLAVSQKLVPGQQAINTDGMLNIRAADMETALAWKNGLISFKNADIKTIMRQVARWYNLKVEYKGAVSKDRFTGSVSRQANLSELLKMLEFNNIRFNMEPPDAGQSEKKLIILP